MSNVFDLEQAILDCWHVTTDIEHVYRASERMTDDQIQNVLIGMKELYEIKFNHMWNEFERFLKDKNESQT